jgi:hypothetical protein
MTAFSYVKGSDFVWVTHMLWLVAWPVSPPTLILPPVCVQRTGRRKGGGEHGAETPIFHGFGGSRLKSNPLPLEGGVRVGVTRRDDDPQDIGATHKKPGSA